MSPWILQVFLIVFIVIHLKSTKSSVLVTLFTNFNRSLTPWVPEHVIKLYSLSRIEHTYVISNLLSIGYHSGFIVKLWPIVLKTVQKTPKVMFPVAMVLTFTYIKKNSYFLYTDWIPDQPYICRTFKHYDILNKNIIKHTRKYDKIEWN